MLKKKLKEETVSNASAKWRNLWFDKNGKCYRGNTLWNTQADAQAVIANFEKDAAQSLVVANTLDGYLSSKSYAWSMQIPILDKE